jgi:hypothetical protein
MQLFRVYRPRAALALVVGSFVCRMLAGQTTRTSAATPSSFLLLHPTDSCRPAFEPAGEEVSGGFVTLPPTPCLVPRVSLPACLIVPVCVCVCGLLCDGQGTLALVGLGKGRGVHHPPGQHGTHEESYRCHPPSPTRTHSWSWSPMRLCYMRA